MKKTLTSIRLEETTLSNIAAAIAKYNQTSITKFSQQHYRRFCYEVVSQLILQDKLNQLPIEILHICNNL